MNSQAPSTPAYCCLDWQISTEALFGYFAAKPWAILLDSAGASHTDANYDIICAEPIATLTHKNGCNCLTDPTTGTAETTHEDPFALISNLLAELYGESSNSSICPELQKLPFTGGVMGAFGYDLGRQIEKLPSLAADDIKLPDLNLGFYDWALIFNYRQKSWYLVHARGESALHKQREKLTAMLQSPTPEYPAFKLETDWQSQITKQEYLQKFEKIQHYLQSGDCYQINLTQRFSAQYAGDEWPAYLRLRNTNKAPFSAFMRLEQQAILSISPERFIKLTQEQIETKPIKGTLPRHPDPIKDQQAADQLAVSPKDRAENLMIVDLLRNDIGKVAAAGTVRVPKLFDVESFPAVHHLVSTITARLKQDTNATDLLRAAFPGGSITGAPKVHAMEIIEQLEPSRRNIYCGAIGYISQNGNMDTSITIRTLVAERGQIYCWAGGGIVADSQGEAEYQETFDKISRILPVLSK